MVYTYSKNIILFSNVKCSDLKKIISFHNKHWNMCSLSNPFNKWVFVWSYCVFLFIQYKTPTNSCHIKSFSIPYSFFFWVCVFFIFCFHIMVFYSMLVFQIVMLVIQVHYGCNFKWQPVPLLHCTKVFELH